MSAMVDALITYRVVKLLITPWNKQKAYKHGIIDDNGKVLIKRKDLTRTEQRNDYTVLHRFVFNLKRLLQKVGLGGRLGSFGVALALMIKEDKSYAPHQELIERTVIKYLKETGQYEEMINEVKDIPISDELKDIPFINCFGVDVFEKDGKLISEYEYENI
jgi:hypothetical protein|tara:strand:+ start:398 stop:880 length:483 start_codon:yes stop_codon:yes gene_type:complete